MRSEAGRQSTSTHRRKLSLDLSALIVTATIYPSVTRGFKYKVYTEIRCLGGSEKPRGPGKPPARWWATHVTFLEDLTGASIQGLLRPSILDSFLYSRKPFASPPWAPGGSRWKGSPTPRAGKGRERLRERFGTGYLSTNMQPRDPNQRNYKLQDTGQSTQWMLSVLHLRMSLGHDSMAPNQTTKQCQNVAPGCTSKLDL